MKKEVMGYNAATVDFDIQSTWGKVMISGGNCFFLPPMIYNSSNNKKCRMKICNSDQNMMEVYKSDKDTMRITAVILSESPIIHVKTFCDPGGFVSVLSPIDWFTESNGERDLTLWDGARDFVNKYMKVTLTADWGRVTLSQGYFKQGTIFSVDGDQYKMIRCNLMPHMIEVFKPTRDKNKVVIEAAMYVEKDWSYKTDNGANGKIIVEV